MNTQKIMESIPDYLEYLSNIGYSKFIINTNVSVTNRFKSYCLSENVKNIDSEVINNFYSTILKVQELKGTYRYVVKRVINGLLDYADNKNIKTCYCTVIAIKLNSSNYDKLLNDYNKKIIEKLDITKESKKRKNRCITSFLNYLVDNNIMDISLLTEENLVNYLNSIKDRFNKKTLSIYLGSIKEFTNYLYVNNLNNNYIGHNLFIANKSRDLTPEYFSKKELQQILNRIDIHKKNGKLHYLVILLLITYGLRIGDIVNLKFENIDFEKDTINIIQAKTQKELTLYLAEQVKYAILDYVKNERPSDIDNQYIFITIHRPYRPYTFSNIDSVIVNLIKKSGVNTEGKKLGSRIFRHSLATNMINNNISLNGIQSILGHTTSNTTAKYITRDINKLELLTLEVINDE